MGFNLLAMSAFFGGERDIHNEVGKRQKKKNHGNVN